MLSDDEVPADVPPQNACKDSALRTSLPSKKDLDLEIA